MMINIIDVPQLKAQIYSMAAIYGAVLVIFSFIWVRFVMKKERKNPKLKDDTEKIFEGIARGRKRKLDTWFKDKWNQLEFVRDGISKHLNQP